jgi:hypothetical protein
MIFLKQLLRNLYALPKYMEETLGWLPWELLQNLLKAGLT